jgi:isochorismate synthase
MTKKLFGNISSFLMVKKPGATQIQTFQINSTPIAVNNPSEYLDKSGFVFFPFDNTHSQGYFFSDLEPCNLDVEIGDNTGENLFSTEKKDYLSYLNQAKEIIQSGEVSKIVLSKISVVSDYKLANLVAQFKANAIHHVNQFAYFIHCENKFTWFGATPEKLITYHHSENKGETVALAGTRKKEEKQPWGEKEKEEHAFVMSYIQDVLEGVDGVTFELSPIETVQVSAVEHLKATFSFSLKDKISLPILIDKLHPTPAVCGTPKDLALEYIRKLEPHDRKYYTGYLGFFNFEDQTDIFVNLRCAEYRNNSVIIYTGGGITKDSNPEAEWEETELKKSTILSLING